MNGNQKADRPVGRELVPLVSNKARRVHGQQRTQGPGDNPGPAERASQVHSSQSPHQPSQLCIWGTRLLPSPNSPDSAPPPSNPKSIRTLTVLWSSPARCCTLIQVSSSKCQIPKAPSLPATTTPHHSQNQYHHLAGHPPVFSLGLCQKSQDLKTLEQCMKQGKFLNQEAAAVGIIHVDISEKRLNH